MSLSASRRTWEEASSPAAVRLAREYEQAWRDSDRARHDGPTSANSWARPAPPCDEPGARLALLRADMTLRWETGEKVGAEWYLDRYSDLGEDTIVALVYEEFCLREEDDENPDPAEYLLAFPQVAAPLGACWRSTSWSARARPATVLPAVAGAMEPVRRPRRFPRPARRSPASSWSRNWGAGRSRGSSWPGSASWPIGPVASR